MGEWDPPVRHQGWRDAPGCLRKPWHTYGAPGCIPGSSPWNAKRIFRARNIIVYSANLIIIHLYHTQCVRARGPLQAVSHESPQFICGALWKQKAVRKPTSNSIPLSPDSNISSPPIRKFKNIKLFAHGFVTSHRFGTSFTCSKMNTRKRMYETCVPGFDECLVLLLGRQLA